MRKIFLINLEDSRDRRVRMSEILDKAGLEYEIFKAVDGRKLSKVDAYDENSQERNGHRKLSPSEIGCYLSHCNAWQKIIDEQLDQAVLFEDDVDVDPRLAQLIDKIDLLKIGWDLIRFSGLGVVPKIKAISLTEDFELCTLLRGSTGMQGYFLSAEGAKKLLKYAFPIKMPVDVYVDHNWITGIKTLAVDPYPVRANLALVSTIESERNVVAKDYNNKIKNRRYAFLRWLVKRSIKINKLIQYPILFAYGVSLRVGLRKQTLK